jgi:hypothetical protein
MALNDLSNKQQLLYDYMKELLRAEFPNVDLSDTGAFMETFGMTHLALLQPLVDFAERVALKQSIENAETLTEDELDQIGQSDYGVDRFAGKYAIGYGTLIFKDIPPTNVLSVPAGLAAISKQGYRYVSQETVTIDETQLGNFYDADTFQFKVPVLFQSDSVGAQYNLKIGELIQLESPGGFIQGITNDVEFTGGADRESNVDYARRIKEGAKTPSLGKSRGYVRFIKDNFPDVQDVLVVGFGHPLMQRDIIGHYNTNFFTQSVYDVHWGTKIDLYLRGRNLQDASETLPLIAIPGSTDIGVKLTNLPVFDIRQVTLTSSDPAVDPTTLLITTYSLVKDENSETVGTLDEDVWVAVHDSRAILGTSVKVSYRYNQLLNDVNELLYGEENRPPTADVLPKEARNKYVFGALIVKQLSSLRLKDTDKSAIRQLIYNFTSGLPMGGELQFSDIHDAITNVDTASQIIDYLRMPSQFMVLDNNSQYAYYCLSEEERNLFGLITASNPFLAAAVAAYRDTITIYDFFDSLHLLTYEDGLLSALQQIGDISADWATKAAEFQKIRSMIVKGHVVTSLSPATRTVQENEYFEVGQFSIYEDKAYSRDDWVNLITLFANLATSTSITDGNDRYYLAAYILTTVYIISSKAQITDSLLPFFAYMQDVASGTPVADKF